MNVQAATLATHTGVQQFRQGDVDGSIQKFREAITLSPDFALAHFQLGLALRQKGDLAQSNEEFAKAAQLDPHLKPPLADGSSSK